MRCYNIAGSETLQRQLCWTSETNKHFVLIIIGQELHRQTTNEALVSRCTFLWQELLRICTETIKHFRATFFCHVSLCHVSKAKVTCKTNKNFLFFYFTYFASYLQAVDGPAKNVG